jgi:hypothetical protein
MAAIVQFVIWLGTFLWSFWPFRKRQLRQDRFKGVAFVEQSHDPTKELHASKLVVIGKSSKPKWLRFRCPCGCGDVIALNLMTSHFPHWSVEIHDDGTLTAHPSVDAKTCGSHFWIRHNLIEWV